MNRTWVYVNTNPDMKHITIHPEVEGPCEVIFQHIKKGGVHFCQTIIETEAYSTREIKIGETSNGFWICVWGKSIDEIENLARTKYAKKIFNGKCDIPQERIEICERCK